jgi:hypothetical protein
MAKLWDKVDDAKLAEAVENSSLKTREEIAEKVIQQS